GAGQRRGSVGGLVARGYTDEERARTTREHELGVHGSGSSTRAIEDRCRSGLCYTEGMAKARLSMVAFALQVFACGSDHSSTQLHGDGGAGAPAASGGGSGAGGAKASGGAGATNSGGAGGDPSVCHASNLSTAPTA